MKAQSLDVKSRPGESPKRMNSVRALPGGITVLNIRQRGSYYLATGNDRSDLQIQESLRGPQPTCVSYEWGMPIDLKNE